MLTDDQGLGAELVRHLVDVADLVAGRGDAVTKLTRLCETAVRTIGCDRSSIFLADEGGTFRACCNHGNPPDIAALFPMHRVDADDPLIARAMESRTYVIANDAPNDRLMDRRVAKLARIRAIVVAPMIDHDDVPVGFMTAEFNERPGSFGELSSTLLLGLAKLGEGVVQSERDTAERLELVRRLEIANRLDTLSRVAAGVAHDLNNQVLVIRGYAEAVRRQCSAPEIDRLIEAVEVTGQLGRRLVVVGREELSDEPQLHDLGDVVSAVADRLRVLAAGHPLRFVLEPGLVVTCAASDIERILSNLVLNADDASPHDSEITVSLSRPLDDGSGSAQPVAELSVRDHGPGIDPNVIDQIFEPFVTTKAPASGTGLGLTSVRDLAHALGGSVSVDSHRDGGAIFTVTLPLHEARPAGGAEIS